MGGCSRPLRARDRSLFGSLCDALAAAERQPVRCPGNVIVMLFSRFGHGESGFLNARCASSVVPALVMQVWYDRPLCGMSVVQGVIRQPVVRIARCGQPGHVRRVVPFTARCAWRNPRCA